METAETAGLSSQGVSRLRAMIGRCGRHLGDFRRVLRGDPSANVSTIKVEQIPGTRAVKARPRIYNPVKTAWLTSCLPTLMARGTLFLHPQVVWASVPLWPCRNQVESTASCSILAQ